MKQMKKKRLELERHQAEELARLRMILDPKDYLKEQTEILLHEIQKGQPDLYVVPRKGFTIKCANLTQSYGITPSMSRRGNPFDNAMAENFFSILKTECLYRHKPASFKEANALIDSFIHFYNHERIQSKTGVAPLSLRLSY